MQTELRRREQRPRLVAYRTRAQSGADHCAEEGGDPYICELAALLHDLADAKIAGDEETGQRRVRDWLVAHEVEPICH